MQGEHHYTFSAGNTADSLDQGLVSNGAKVYVVALPSDPIDEVVKDLNQLGSETGGSAFGHVSLLYLLN